MAEPLQSPILASDVEREEVAGQRAQGQELSSSTPVPEEEMGFCERFAVGIVFTIFVVFRAADRAFLYRVQKYLKDSTYLLILSNIIWPVSIQLMTIGMLLAYICMLRAQGQTQYTWRFFLPGNPAASSVGPVPLYRLALFSLGDQINAAVSAPPSPFIQLPLQSIMTNLVIVWMLMLASVWLGTRFKQVHYIGCTLIVLAVVVGVADKLEADNCTSAGLDSGECLTSYKGADGSWKVLEGSSMALWYGLFVLSTVPAAVSNCYKQKVLKGVDLDIVYATWWSGNFQVVWGLLLFWVNWIPVPEQNVPPPSATFQEIADTWQCFIGNVPHEHDQHCAGEGGPAVKWFIIYLCFNLTFNICLLWLTKRMSAMWAQIATTLCLDLTNIFSQYKFIVGASATLMTLCQWLATVLASIALWTYNLEPEILPGNGRENVQERSFRARSFGPSMLHADGRASLVESLSFQRAADPPISYVQTSSSGHEGRTLQTSRSATSLVAGSLRTSEAGTWVSPAGKVEVATASF